MNISERALQAAIRSLRVTQDYSLGAGQIDELHLLLRQYLEYRRSLPPVPPAQIRRSAKKLRAGLKQIVEALRDLQGTAQGGSWLLRILLGRGAVDSRHADRVLQLGRRLESRIKRALRDAQTIRPALTTRRGPKEEPEYETLVRHLYAFWHRRLAELHEGQPLKDATPIYEAIGETLVLVGLKRSLKSLRNLRPADSRD